MILKCDYCGKEYKTYISPRCKNHFCSRECNYKARNTKEIKKCANCGKEIYVRKSEIKVNNFCSNKCFNDWQGRNKIKLICKICGKEFYRSASWIINKKGYYCCIECRNKDENWKQKSVYKANIIQCNKKGLNKLEKKGNEILNRLNIKYETQYLINNKICVDVFIPEKNIIIQWDGNYWHGKNKKYEELEPRIKKRVDLDKSQDEYLKKCGYKVIRFWEEYVMKKEEEVYDNIKRAIQ